LLWRGLSFSAYFSKETLLAAMDAASETTVMVPVTGLSPLLSMIIGQAAKLIRKETLGGRSVIWSEIIEENYEIL